MNCKAATRLVRDWPDHLIGISGVEFRFSSPIDALFVHGHLILTPMAQQCLCTVYLARSPPLGWARQKTSLKYHPNPSEKVPDDIISDVAVEIGMDIRAELGIYTLNSDRMIQLFADRARFTNFSVVYNCIFEFCSRRKAACDVLFGRLVGLTVADKCVTFRDPRSNRSGEIRLKAVGCGIFGRFSNFDKCRPEGAGDVTSGMAVA